MKIKHLKELIEKLPDDMEIHRAIPPESHSAEASTPIMRAKVTYNDLVKRIVLE